MNIHLTIVEIFDLLGVLLGMLYAFQIWTLKHRTAANRFFAFLILNFSFIFLVLLLAELGFNTLIKFLSLPLVVALLIIPVNLWIYIKKLVSPEPKPSIKQYFPIFFLVLAVLVFAIIGYIFKRNPYTNFLFDPYLRLIILTLFFVSVNVIYIIKGFRLLKQHKKMLQNYFSYTQKLDLKWAWLMLYGHLLLFIFLIIPDVFPSQEASDVIYKSAMIAYIIYIGHNALKQKEEWKEVKTPKEERQSNDENNTIEAENEIYSENKLLQFEELKSKLLQIMEEEKPYLDQDLTLNKLAKDLNSNTTYLSYVINTKLNQNFMNFINEYRIQKMKELLQNNKSNYTIEALAQSAGFKSKSSFNTAFKKSTGLTPSNYLASIQ